MSSIYRKGSDGYFYYQTYVKNPETGKKDKKLFISRNTSSKIIWPLNDKLVIITTTVLVGLEVQFRNETSGN